MVSVARQQPDDQQRDVDDGAEIPTTPYWRSEMKRARGEKGLQQWALAQEVGTSQPTINEIESGRITRSRFVATISSVLGIPQPFTLIQDDMDRRWIEIGRTLRANDPVSFDAYLKIFEAQQKK
jgi:DNA-binding XRE family transcriptional regulator